MSVFFVNSTYMLKSDCITAVLPLNTKTVFVAYSGGVDSHVLLHLVALSQDLKLKVTAVYIDHGLQVEANEWAEHCERIALALGVDFKCIKVDINKIAGQSLEELARDARYQALKSLLGENDIVLLAQHRDDQMETVLLQLFRGSGVQGLSGMPLSKTFGKGLMCRPLLDVSKQQIIEYAEATKLGWVEDPSNKSDDFDRNFLRNQIVPQLKKKWPALDKTISRSARHCANNHHLTEVLAKELLSHIAEDDQSVLDIKQLLVLDVDRQYLVIRQWFKANQLRMPSEKIVQNIVNEVVHADESKKPEIRGQGYRIKRYRTKLFCLKPSIVDRVDGEQVWAKGSMELKLESHSRLLISDSDKGILKQVWESATIVVKYRQGTEKIRLPGRKGSHSLKKLYQEKAIPPWQRSYIPLIYLDDNLAAVADLWISADYFSDERQACYQLDWVKL